MNDLHKVEEKVKKYCSRKENINFSIGITDGKNRETALYGTCGKYLDDKPVQYEIGSCTKTMTAALFAKLLYEKRISLNQTLSDFITLSGKSCRNPTLNQLLTHTAGYGEFKGVKLLDILTGASNSRCPFETLTRKELEQSILSFNKEKQQNEWSYSNVGYGVLGLILEKIYQEDYIKIMTDYLQETLGMKNTSFLYQPNHLLSGYNNHNNNCGNWKWDQGPIAAAGGLRSNMEDMLTFTEHYLDESKPYLRIQLNPLENINVKTGTKIGMAWFLKDGLCYHSGGTGCFESLLAINLQNNKAVAILSNYRNMYKPYKEQYSIVKDILI